MSSSSSYDFEKTFNEGVRTKLKNELAELERTVPQLSKENLVQLVLQLTTPTFREEQRYTKNIVEVLRFLKSSCATSTTAQTDEAYVASFTKDVDDEISEIKETTANSKKPYLEDEAGALHPMIENQLKSLSLVQPGVLKIKLLLILLNSLDRFDPECKNYGEDGGALANNIDAELCKCLDDRVLNVDDARVKSEVEKLIETVRECREIFQDSNDSYNYFQDVDMKSDDLALQLLGKQRKVE